MHITYWPTIICNSFSCKLKKLEIYNSELSLITPWYKNLPLMLAIPGRETVLSWAVFWMSSPGDCGNSGNADGFDVKLCTCSVTNTHGFSY